MILKKEKKKQPKEKIDYKFDKYTLVILVVIIIDQLSKLAVTNLLGTKKIDFLFFHFGVIGNPGFAFGLTSGSNILNVLLALVFIGVIIKFLITQQKNIVPAVQIVLYLILGGAISNIIDRVIRGAVVDFIGVGSFPVFNIADICIVIGWCLFVYSFIMFAVKREEAKIENNNGIKEEK